MVWTTGPIPLAMHWGLLSMYVRTILPQKGKLSPICLGASVVSLNPLHLMVTLPLGFYRIRISVREAERCTGTELGSCQHVDDLVTEAEAKSRGTEWITGQPMVGDTEALCCIHGRCHHHI